jgi:hypothetical protein
MEDPARVPTNLVLHRNLFRTVNILNSQANAHGEMNRVLM